MTDANPVSAYDQLNPWGPDYDYWLALVERLAPSSIVDLGCGTGQLTVLFARDQESARVVGVDPHPNMLATARARADHALVRWVDGYASAISSNSADLITMTRHVAQVFVSDDDWAQVLDESRRALTDQGATEVWHEVISVEDRVVTYDTTTRWLETDTSQTFTDTLRFRDERELRATLTAAGFDIEHIHGTWDGADATRDSAELIVTAVRRAS